ncbi:MAG: HAD hydrolase-like protein [Pseudobutyrivibrio sp.]|uniref:HAD hydrolase-like protein n=1 Tax=Pseudobutyrivibrio sp. TaxID=2014367 RepID=UPI0025DB2595|nr:HAD hydrolase-like protein [Pseudobutyrivibrio sp.]MBQ8490582.1 HAD hydrolase-like protein [Pseudobutyrivibrio sp.]
MLSKAFINHFYSIALYGLGTETERLISQWGSGPKIVGLLDGFKESGEAFGYPIISLQQAVDAKVEAIIVVARPGSCKVIAKRIKAVCQSNGILVYDVRGNDLLAETKVLYDFGNINVYTKSDLLAKVQESDVISFDLFDTLIARKVLYYTDIFELIDAKLREQKIYIPEFSKLRLAAEKELSKNAAPKLSNIYDWVISQHPECNLSSNELAEIEWQIDKPIMYTRDGMKDLLSEITTLGKRIVVTTDTYYSKQQIEELLALMGYKHIDKVYVSSEYNVSKANGLFEIVKNDNRDQSILHIGDDEYVDIEKASEYGLNNYRIYGAKDIFDEVGAFGLSSNIKSYSDNVKAGLALSKLFSNPFQFETSNKKISINNAKDIGYFICGPMVLDFAFWFEDKLRHIGAENALLCARDGYLLKKIFDRIDSEVNSVYFLTSRTSAIRAGIENEDDIAYVDSMKFFGTQEESMIARYGITLKNDVDRNITIINKAKLQRENYQKYISNLNLKDVPTAVFDFVAKGTTQLFLQKIMNQPLKGLYFLQLEPEFMADKGIDIESFYTEKERDTSAIFDNYYILETILTSPMPSVDEFDEAGQPVYAKETRSDENLECVSRMQQGIMQYVDDYLEIVPVSMRQQNKMLDEAFLTLIGKLEITDQSFKNLVVEDPFFGRMTNIVDVM